MYAGQFAQTMDLSVLEMSVPGVSFFTPVGAQAANARALAPAVAPASTPRRVIWARRAWMTSERIRGSSGRDRGMEGSFSAGSEYAAAAALPDPDTRGPGEPPCKAENVNSET